MNILHVVPYYAPAWSYGGVVRAVTDLTRAQAAAGHSVTVLTGDTLTPQVRVKTRRETLEGVDVVRFANLSNGLRGRLNLSTPRGLRREMAALLDTGAIDVVHCHEVRTVENWLAAPLAQQAGVPVVVSPHGTLTYDAGRATVKRLWDRWVGPRVLRQIDGVIALTGAEAAEARAHWQAAGVPLPDRAVWVVPNGVTLSAFERLPSPESFRARWQLGEGPVVLFLGRLHERKGLHLLIPAFAQAVSQSPEARLLIAGPDEGMLARLRTLAAEQGLANRVIFTGMLSGNERLAALAAADLFALPAVGEGFSMAVLEAMACGLPLLLTPGCHFPEAADEGAGLVVARDVEALAGGLRRLLGDGDARQRMGQRARDLVRVRYTWAQVAAQMADVYRAAIHRQEEA